MYLNLTEMIVYLLDTQTNECVKAEIILSSRYTFPPQKRGWKFNWSKLRRNRNTQTYILRTLAPPFQTQGALQLALVKGMLIMNYIEIAPHNRSSEKRYRRVAGCLIAFACGKSMLLDGPYKGYLTFVSKSHLVDWYRSKYFATLVSGQRMYISPENGIKLIQAYITFEEDE